MSVKSRPVGVAVATVLVAGMTLGALLLPAISFAAPNPPAAGSDRGDDRGGGGFRQMDPAKMTPAQKAQLKSRQNLAQLRDVISGIPALEKNKKLAITAAQAKKLLPVVKRVIAKDLLGVNKPLPKFTMPTAGQTQAAQGQGPNQAQRGTWTPAEAAAAKVIETALIDMENCLNSSQLGEIDAIAMKQGQGGTGAAGNQAVGGFRRNFGGMAGGFGAGARQDSDRTAPTADELAKLQKEIQARLAEAQKAQKKLLTDLLALVTKKAK